ncbi:hypothetical protein CCACVL1_29161 [Corchorus capsularis]|uniref:Uncharacterized protein n=1 Tax=Corchorus capsularis TaxID=210143 RepID=A0A1R3G3F2_COCAP|nr:hypothetical protein CCACVL1_29161 [Corchorus capsularis]
MAIALALEILLSTFSPSYPSQLDPQLASNLTENR